MGNPLIPNFDSSSTSPSSTRPSSPGIARNTSNEGTHSGSTRLDEDFPNEQILTPPNLTFTFAKLETAIGNLWREREMGDSWIPHFYSCSTSPSWTRPSSLGIAQNTSNEGTPWGSTRLDEDFPNEQILTSPNLTFTFAELETAIGNFWREREMGDSWIPHYYSTSPSSTRPSSLGIARNTSNEGTHSGSTRLDEDFPNEQILTPPNLTFTFAELETAIGNFWREREMGDSWIPHFYSCSTSPSSTRPSSLGIAWNTSNEGTHSGLTRLDEDFPNEQILTPPNLTFTFAELETAIGNFWREREMGDSWIPHFYSCSTSPSSTRPSSLGIARNTSNEGTPSGSTRLDEDFPNEQILTPPNLTFTFAELETAIGNFWREREMGDSWIPHFYSCSTSPSSTRPSSLGIARNTSNEGTPSGSTRLDEDFPNEQILTPPNLTFTFAELETAIGNFWRGREMGDSWIPHFYSCSTSPSSTRPSSLGIAQNTSNEGTPWGSTRLDEDFPNEQILTPPNLTFTFAELETAIRNFWREREMGDSWIPHFYSCSTSPSSSRPSSLEIAQNTSNEGTHLGTGSAFPTRLDEHFPNGQIATTSNLTTFTSAELETATRNFQPDTVLGRGRFLKQKLVVVVDMHNAKSRIKAMKFAVRLPGVISVSIEADKNQLTVVGERVDPVNLIMQLRKRMNSKINRLFRKSIVCSELVSVTTVDEKSKEEEKKPEPIVAWPYLYYPTVLQPHYSRNDNCSIM